MKILFITSSRIGDAVLSTGILNYIAEKFPEAKVTIVCGPLATSLFEGYPNLDRIIPLKKKKANAHWIDLWKEVSGENWDRVIDLRNSLATYFLRTNRRFSYGKNIDKKKHKVEQMAEVLRLKSPPAPKLWFTEKQKRDAKNFMNVEGPILAIGPTANWPAKMWPSDRFVEIINDITRMDGILPDAHVAIFAAKGEEKEAFQVLRFIPDDRQINMVAKVDPGTAAAALAHCDLFIGNDSGLMHCAAAVGTQTIGLFGPGFPEIYRPWGDHADYISTPENFKELTNYQGYNPKTAPCLMKTLTVEDVKKKIDRFWVK
jgi:ADP-heptose:LPS heptosyltransferase